MIKSATGAVIFSFFESSLAPLMYSKSRYGRGSRAKFQEEMSARFTGFSLIHTRKRVVHASYTYASYMRHIHCRMRTAKPLVIATVKPLSMLVDTQSAAYGHTDIVGDVLTR